MKITHTQHFVASLLAFIFMLNPAPALAGEISHYAPGLANIRDFVVPAPGYYGAWYNYKYMSDRLNDPDGHKIKSVTINPFGGPGITLAVDVNVKLFATAPMFIWVSDYKIAGAKYAAYIAPSFATSSLDAALFTINDLGRSLSNTSKLGVGDMLVQPFWLGWTLTNWDFALGYGFYAPIGRYDTQTFTLPVVGPVKTESLDNIGLGFWTHQLQGAVTWYPWEHKATAVAAALTYEINGKKKDFDLTPGQNLSLNWGISQYLPLNEAKTLLVELGPAGYSSWQLTKDRGSDASKPRARDEVHAVGGQLGLTYAPFALVLNFHGFREFAAEDRFQGKSFGLNLAKKF